MNTKHRKAAARIAVASAVLSIATGVTILTPLAAQADPPAVTLNNISAVLEPYTPGVSQVRVIYDVDLAVEDPTNPGEVSLVVEEHFQDCSTSDLTSIQTYVEDVTAISTVFVLDSGAGYVTVTVSPGDGAGGFGAPTTFTLLNGLVDPSQAPAVSITPDGSGLAGSATVDAGGYLPSYDYGLWVNGGQVGGDITIGECSQQVTPFAGLAPGDLLEIRSVDLPGAVLASYTAPGGASGFVAALDVGEDSSADDATAPTTPDKLAYTGGGVSGVALVLAIVLLGTGGYLTLFRRRRMGTPTS